MWDPTRDFGTEFMRHLNTVQHHFDRMEGMRTDVLESANAFKFIADAPGLKKDEIEVNLRDPSTLCFSGVRLEEPPTEGESYIRRGRFFGKFEQCFKLQVPVRSETVRAVYKDQTLTVTMDKLQSADGGKVKVQ